MVADQKYYMNYLTEELKKLGVKFVQQRVSSVYSPELDYVGVVNSGNDDGEYWVDSDGGADRPVRIVINCCGLQGDVLSQVDDDHRTPAAAASSSSSSSSSSSLAAAAAAAASYPIRGQVIR